MSDRVLLALAVVIGVPAVLVGYVALIELGLRRLSFRWQRSLRPWLWLAPALSFLVVFLVYPVIRTAYLSLFNATSSRWVGFDNYQFIFTNEQMLIVLRNNVLWLVLFTALTVGLGLLLATLTDRVRYESVAKSVIFLPMAISFVAAGVIWKFMYDYKPPGVPQTGTVNAIFTAILPDFQPQAWLINTPQNNVALIIAAVWAWTGFSMVVLSAALKGIPTDVLEAGRVDGASEWRLFWRVVLPMLAPTLAVVATTMVITSLKIFDIVYVMTSGNFDTDVIANRMYKEMFNFRNFGRASALAVILMLAVIPVMLINLRRFQEQEANR
ncbi:MAG: carbohydrate ABC transporter permease [Dehalococcoidia bacterium]